MTLDQLRIFIAVAEHDHITRAAEALNMTQSAVSSAIAALEKRHGIMMFDRIGRSISLNRIGRAFLPEARAVLARAGLAVAVLTDLSGATRGTLPVMASQTVAGYWLSARLAEFHRRFPEVTVEIGIGNTVQVADAVESGMVELGFVEGRIERPALESSVIAWDEMILVVGPDHDWARRTAISPADLSSTSWVVREPGSGTRSAFDRLVSEAGIDADALRVAMIAPDNEIMIGMVAAGVGATLVSRLVALSSLRGGLLHEVSYPALRRPFYALRHRARYRSRAADAFVALIAESGNHDN